MVEKENIIQFIKEELNKQHFGVFNTVRNDSPHSTLVCFANTDDMQYIIFFTPKNSRKFINSQIYEKVTLFVDNTSNNADDIKNAMTISISGEILDSTSLDEELKQQFREIYLKKNPHMDFFMRQNIEMVIIKANKYELVTHFQTVADIDMKHNYELSMRQVQGKPLNNGEVRGSISLEDNIKDGTILVCESFKEEYSKYEFSGLLEITSSELGKKYAKNKGIAHVGDINEGIDLFETGESITIDGYLGIIILHKVK